MLAKHEETGRLLDWPDGKLLPKGYSAVTEAARVGTLDVKYHASQNKGAVFRDTRRPCRVCGWAEHMAIHDAGSRSVKGYGHEYQS